ncbi:MAG: PTS sugar transporter subunit IIC [Candidatus Izemoplasmataceae bacterium]
MLQFKNVLKKPIIWGPVILASAILGPLATVLFKMESTPIGSGMGTSGLIGQIGTLDAMGYETSVFLSIIILHFVLPIILVFIFDLLFRKKGWIQLDDLTV